MSGDAKGLLELLTRNASLALQRGVAAAASATQYEVTVEHLVLELLSDPGSDVALLVDRYGVDGAGLRAALARSLDELRVGCEGAPAVAPLVLDWMRRARDRGAAAGYGKVRSGALFAELVAEPATYSDAAGLAAFLACVPADQLVEAFAGLDEESEARGGAPAPTRPAAAPARPTSIAHSPVDGAASARADSGAPASVGSAEPRRPLAIKELVKLLTRPGVRALEAALEAAVSAEHYEITVEHVLLELLDDPGADVAALVGRWSLDAARLRKLLTRSLEELRTGNAERPAYAAALVAWLQDAWASGGFERLRTGALFARAAKEPAKYVDADQLVALLGGIPRGDLDAALMAALAGFDEEAEARGGEPAPLRERARAAAAPGPEPPAEVAVASAEARPAPPARAAATPAPALDPKELVKRLTRPGMRALEAALAAAVRAGHQEVTAEHLLLELLDDPGSDLVALVAHHGVDRVALRGHVSRSLDELRSGQSERRPSFGASLMTWLGDGWTTASEAGFTKLRTGVLFARLVGQPSKYTDASGVQSALGAVPRDELQAGIGARLAGLDEEAEARGGAPAALRDRTPPPKAPPPKAAAAASAATGAPDVKELVKRLTRPALRALEAAVARAMRAQHRETTADHLLLELLDDPGSDAALLLERYGVRRDAVRALVAGAVEELRGGNTERRPAFAPRLVAWMHDAWSATSRASAYTKLRSGALLATLALDPSRYCDAEGLGAALARIPREEMKTGVAERLTGFDEESEARGGAAAALRDRLPPPSIAEPPPPPSTAEPPPQQAPPTPVDAPAPPAQVDAPTPAAPEAEVCAVGAQADAAVAAPPVDPVTRLSRAGARALDAGLARAMRFKHREVTVEHVLLALVDDDESDVAAVVRARALDADRMRGVLYRTLDRLPEGASEPPVRSARLTAWLADAWDAAAARGWARLRSAALFERAVEASATYTVNGTGAPSGSATLDALPPSPESDG